MESQEATLSELLLGSAMTGQNGLSKFLSPREAAHHAISAAADRKGKGAPLSDLVQDAAHRAGRQIDSGPAVRAMEALVDVQHFEVVPGAREQLQRLKREGIGTAVVSNISGESGRSIRRVMERLDLAQFIDSWALSEELPWAKPSPEIFWRALEPLNALPSEAVHIGDMGTDIYGARAAGFRAAVLFLGARAYGSKYAALCYTSAAIDPPPNHELSHWSELPPLMESLFGSV